MSDWHLVRVGVLGHVGRFRSAGEVCRRGAEVLVRTARGVEVGEVLAAAAAAGEAPDGALLRRMTVEDQLLNSRLQQSRDEAVDACEQLIAERGIGATLLDAELLFDGSSLYFYFLGEATPELEQLTDQLAEAYDTQAQLRRFAEAVEAGCGPGCGAEDAAGCSSGACATCAVAGACGAKG